MNDTVGFSSIESLTQHFVSGKYKPEQTVSVEGTVYEMYDAAPISILESINGKCPIVVYTTKTDINQILVFSWQSNSRNAIQPAGAAIIEGNIATMLCNDPTQLIIEMDGEKITIRPDQLVGDVVRVSFTGLSNPKELEGKIDTGATVSSLHADHYQIKGNQIEFTCKPLSDNLITVPLKTQHAVKSPDGGTVYRPVIELDVKINGKLIKSAMFNLNDRSHMEQAVLIGQNVLQAGKFYVDPSRTESVSGVDWEHLQVLAETIPMLHRRANEEVLHEFYQQMLESDITFNDLVRHIRWEVIKTFEDAD